MPTFDVGSRNSATGKKNEATTIFNVPLSDHRLERAGIDPQSLIGRGITNAELNARLTSQKKRKVASK